MKLILEHAGQSIEYEFLTRSGASLTNEQATAAINLAYEQWKGSQENPPAAPTLRQKATLLLMLLADQMIHVARQQRRSELNVDNEALIEGEIG